MWDTMCFTSETHQFTNKRLPETPWFHTILRGMPKAKDECVPYLHCTTWTHLYLNAIPIFVPFFMFCQNGCELFTRLKQLNGVCNTADILSAPPLKNSTANQDFSVSTTVQRSLPHLGQKRAKKCNWTKCLLCIVLASSFFTLSLRSCRILIASNPRMAKSCSVTNGP